MLAMAVRVGVAVCLLTVLSALTTFAGGNVGIDFVRALNYNQMWPQDSAGAVVAQTNWNNVIASPDGSTNNISDSLGTASGLTVAYSGFEANYSTMATFSNGDGKMMWSYADNEDGGAAITLSGIANTPYDVYVYFGSSGDGATGTIGINGANTFSYSTYSATNAFPASYKVTTDISTNYPPSNYAVWSGLKDASFTVTITKVNGNSGVHGLQIVPGANAKPAEAVAKPAPTVTKPATPAAKSASKKPVAK